MRFNSHRKLDYIYRILEKKVAKDLRHGAKNIVRKIS